MKILARSHRGRTLLVAAFVVLTPSFARAGTFPYWGVSFGTPARTAAHLGLAFGRSIPSHSEGFSLGTGPVVELTAGRGAGKLSLGKSILILTDEKNLRIFADVKAVGTRTWDKARGASPHATYLGVEGGLSVAFVRASLGVSKRLQDKSTGADVLFNWGLGLQIRVGRRRPAE